MVLTFQVPIMSFSNNQFHWLLRDDLVIRSETGAFLLRSLSSVLFQSNISPLEDDHDYFLVELSVARYVFIHVGLLAVWSTFLGEPGLFSRFTPMTFCDPSLSTRQWSSFRSSHLAGFLLEFPILAFQVTARSQGSGIFGSLAFSTVGLCSINLILL